MTATVKNFTVDVGIILEQGMNELQNIINLVGKSLVVIIGRRSSMNYSKAEANYNMGFNNGHFKQGKVYKYRYDKEKENKEKEKVFAVTEEGTEQDFFYSEFDILFTFLKD